MAMHKEKGSAAPQFVSNIATVFTTTTTTTTDTARSERRSKERSRASVNLRATRELVGLLLRDWLTLITR